MNCRHCHAKLEHVFLDLGFAPPSNAYLTAADLKAPEKYFPLKLYVCEHCWLVQTEDYVSAETFFDKDYAYFSSTSSSWLEHAKRFSQMIIERNRLDSASFVVEIASNDGYLLKNFVSADIPCLGIEPTNSTASAAKQLGIPVLSAFFDSALAHKLANEGKQADLIVANNVLAHVPDINDFLIGIKVLLKRDGLVTFEFPHLLNLIKCRQFDTVYHEHFSYLSLFTVTTILNQVGLVVFDVEILNTHGGSLRVYGVHQDSQYEIGESVRTVLRAEKMFGLRSLSCYQTFQAQADKVKNDLLFFLIEQKRANKSVICYGAAAKGNTLLNYAGIKPDLLPFVVDAAPSKQGKFLPGSHIPIYAPEVLEINQPDYVLILPWNLTGEIQEIFANTALHNCNFVVAIPKLSVLP